MGSQVESNLLLPGNLPYGKFHIVDDDEGLESDNGGGGGGDEGLESDNGGGGGGGCGGGEGGGGGGGEGGGGNLNADQGYPVTCIVG